MNSSTNIIIKTNNNQNAKTTAALIREIASSRIPETPNEMKKFINGIVVENNLVKIEKNYSLFSCSFRELMPQIMTKLAKNNLCAISMKAYYDSFNCGYKAKYIGQLSKDGKIRMFFEESE